MQPSGDRPDELGQPRLHRHVDVVVLFGRYPTPGREILPDALQTVHQHPGVGGRHDALLTEHGGVRDRRLEILSRDREVDLGGGREPLEVSVDLAREAATQAAHSPSEIRLPASVRSLRAVRRMKPVASAWSYTSSASKVAVASSYSVWVCDRRPTTWTPPL